MSKTQYFYATGKRKTAIARVKMHEHGSGDVTVNERPLKKHFEQAVLSEIAVSPLSLTNNRNTFDITVSLQGGGPHSQAEALRHGISRALVLFDPQLRSTLKREGFLTRDSRIRERKKPGLKRARRAPQWSKR